MEVETGEYIFLPQSGTLPNDRVQDIYAYIERMGNISRGVSGNTSRRHETRHNVEPGAFYHNPIHDAESLWWICVEKVLTKQILIDGEPIVDEERFKKQWRTAANIFPSVEEAKKRKAFLRNEDVFNACMATLEPRMAGVVKALGEFRIQLKSVYEMAEATAPVISCDGFAGERLYELVGICADLVSEAKGMVLQDFEEDWIKGVTAYNATKTGRTSKRKRTAETILGPFVRRRTTQSTYAINVSYYAKDIDPLL